MPRCIVSYLDTDGLRHSVEVEAEGLFEAAVRAVKVFRQHNCEPAELSNLEIEVRTSVIHTVTLKRVRQWLNGRARTPGDALKKQQLRELL